MPQPAPLGGPLSDHDSGDYRPRIGSALIWLSRTVGSIRAAD
jgi:hypothetical protein